MVCGMARGKQVTSYVPVAQVEAFDKMVEDSGQTVYLFLADLIERELEEKGYWSKPVKKSLNLEGTALKVPAPVTANRRRHARRRKSS